MKKEQTEEFNQEEEIDWLQEDAADASEPQTNGSRKKASFLRYRFFFCVKLAIAAVILLILLVIGLILYLKFMPGNQSGESVQTEETVPNSSDDQSGEKSSDQGSDESSSSADKDDKASQDSSDASGSEEPNTENEPYVLTYNIRTSWNVDDENQKSTVDFSFTNHTEEAIKDWELVLTVDGLVSIDDQGWEAVFEQIDGTLHIKPAEYNNEVATNASIKFGCNIGTTEEFRITAATFGDNEIAVVEGKVDLNEENNDAPTEDASAVSDSPEDNQESNIQNDLENNLDIN